MWLLCETSRPVFPFFLFLPCKRKGPFFCLLVVEFLQARACVSLSSSILSARRALSISSEEFSWSIFLNLLFPPSPPPPQTSYYLDGGPSRLLPQFLFSLFHLFAFFVLLGRSSSGLSSNPYVTFFIYIFNFQDLFFSFPNAPSTENEGVLLPFLGLF